MKKIDKFLQLKSIWRKAEPKLSMVIHEEYIDGEETEDGIGFTRRVSAEVSHHCDGGTFIQLIKTFQNDGGEDERIDSFMLHTDAIDSLKDFVDSLEDDEPFDSQLTIQKPNLL